MKIIKKKKETTKTTKNKIEYDGYSIQEKFGGNRYEYLIFNGDEIKNLLIYHNELTDEEAEKILKDFLKRLNTKVILTVEHKGATLTQNEKYYTKVSIPDPDGVWVGMEGCLDKALTEDEAKKTIEAALKAYEDRMKAYEERKKAMESAK